MNVGQYELAGKYTDACYFNTLGTELVTESSDPGAFFPVQDLPDWLQQDNILTTAWGVDTEKFWIQSSTPDFEELTTMLWFGVNLSNGQWYQSTVNVTFESYCDDLRFYTAKEHQIVYASISDEMPFTFRPAPVEAITAEIRKACVSSHFTE